MKLAAAVMLVLAGNAKAVSAETSLEEYGGERRPAQDIRET